MDFEKMWASGRYEEAKNILKDCLFHIRRIMLQNKEKKENAGYISIESCMVYLCNYIKQAHKLASGDTLCNNNQGTCKQDTSKEIDEQQPMAYYGNDFIWQIENEEFTAFLSDNYIYMPRERKVFSFDIGGVTSICTNLTKMLASVTCLFSAFQQNNPQNTQERHSQKEDYSLAL